MNSFISFSLVLIFGLIAFDISCARQANSIPYDSEEDGNLPFRAPNYASTSNYSSGAILKKNRVKGPADMGLYYINSASGKCRTI